MVTLRAQSTDHTSEQAPLHADLDQKRQVDQGQRFESGDRAAHVSLAALLAGEKQPRTAHPAKRARLLEHPCPVLLDAQAMHRAQVGRLSDMTAHLLADAAPAAVEEFL